MPMGDSGFRSIARTDPRLAPYVASPQPAWLWSADGSRILWSNDAGVAALGAADPRMLEKPRSPADPHGRQVARLARQLGFGRPRLERLRGFGARLGQLMTCACSRFECANGEAAILLVAMDSFIRTAPTASSATIASASSDNDRILSQPLIDEPIAEAASTAPRMNELSEIPGTDLPADVALTGEGRDEGRTEAADDTAAAALAVSAVQDQTVEVSQSDPDEPPFGARATPSDAERPDHTTGPLRFVWHTDRMGGFSLTSDAFRRLAGHSTASLQGRPWREFAATLGLDPHGRIEQALDNGETFSGIVVLWPLEGLAEPGRVELSGMPIFDSARDFAGYRGFGIYRPGVLPDHKTEAPRSEPPEPTTNPSELSTPAAALAPRAPDSPSHGETEIVEPPQNVVPFPLAGDIRIPSLSAVENHAFDEIARRLALGLESQGAQEEESAPAAVADRSEPSHEEAHTGMATANQPAWLAAAAPPARGESSRDRMLLDLVPSGILVYRLDRLLYANRAFLHRTGFASLQAMQDAGGLDALYVEPAESAAGSTSDEGMPLKVASPASHSPCAARLFAIAWDDEAAHALILQDAAVAAPSVPADPPQAAAAQPAAADAAFEAILETATDGIVLFDRSGEIVSCNRSAQALFGMKDHEFRVLNFAELFAAESQRIVLDYFESLERPLGANPLDHGREVLGRERAGGLIPLSMTMGRCGSDGDRYFAVFRDLSELRKNEAELLNARRSAERATAARADVLTSISHEIRGPLNTIIGFADVMIEERFGLLGNERYTEYLKDIRASAERAIAVLGGIVDISSIEAGNLNLKPISQNLNEMVVQCVSVLQPQANRERVIIRTSLAHGLPQVMADTQALRQITMNIVASSIRFSKAGGQVIVSTAASDDGGAILRVRDTGRGLSEAELASALGSHRTAGADRGAIDLSLARALAEANRAHFQIKTTENSGTLIEVAFANQRALAG